MEEYKINGNTVEIMLTNGKIVKCDKTWAETTAQTLDISFEDTLLMYLEDNDYLINQEQEELDKKAKGKVKPQATDKTKAKAPRERTQKENPAKESIIAEIAQCLHNLAIENLRVENKAKLITFDYMGESYKIDLIQKRKPKQK